MSDITLYFAPASRAFAPLWLLEELGLPYALKTISLGRGVQKSERYRTVNPMGKVPALRDGEVAVAESPAICLYLADRYSYGDLAPQIEDKRRGAYLRWMVFSTAVLEPSIYTDDAQTPEAASGRGWGDRATVVAAIDDALRPECWLLGEQFSAADVMVGSILSIALFNGRFAKPSTWMTDYRARLEERPAFQRAAAITWPRAS